MLYFQTEDQQRKQDHQKQRFDLWMLFYYGAYYSHDLPQPLLGYRRGLALGLHDLVDAF